MTTIRIAKRARFTTMDRDTVNDERLSLRARGLLLWLLDKPDNWRVDSDQISDACTEGRDAIRTALNELEALGYLTREKSQDAKGRWTSTTTVFERPQPTPGNPTPGLPTPENQALLVELCTKTVTNTPTPPADDSSFDAFWSEYPKKVGKPAARRAYRGACTRSTADKIYAGLQEWLPTWEKTESRFIPHPATWLNQDRWDDAPEASGSWELDGARMSEFTR